MRFLPDDSAPNFGKTSLRYWTIEGAFEIDMSKGHVPKLTGILEGVMPFDFHAWQAMCLPGAVNRKISGFGAGHNLDLYAQFKAATPADLDLPDVVGFVRDYDRSR